MFDGGRKSFPLGRSFWLIYLANPPPDTKRHHELYECYFLSFTIDIDIDIPIHICCYQLQRPIYLFLPSSLCTYQTHTRGQLY